MSDIKRLSMHPIVHVFIVSTILWLVFARTLGSYFLADDFGEIAYASRIFSGEYNLLWSDFTSNFMQVPGMAVWRPWLMVSLFIDFCIWQANPMGFYLTNLLSINVVVILFYLLIYNLTKAENQYSCRLVALLSASLFAVSPLHCESISWVVGRVDIICGVFYMACLNLSTLAERQYANGNSFRYKAITTGAVVCFWLAMWSKEMAIGAPVVATTIFLLFGQKPLNIKRALKLSAPLWLSTIVYFCLRYLALGTLLGGYVQGIGDSQAANALSRWLDTDTLRRLFLPFAYSIFGENSWQQLSLESIYIVFLTLIAIRIITATISLRWLVFLAIWFITCLAPLYKLWGLGYELEGARFCFFLTLPLSLAAPALILLEEKSLKLAASAYRALALTTTIATTSAVIILGRTAWRNNLDWVHAGQEVRSVTREAQRIAQQLPSPKQKILILGIPKRLGGAHMILNGATFTTALRPPFTKLDYSAQFQTFDPVQFAETPFINSDRFKKLVSEGHPALVWNSKARQFNQVKYKQVNAETRLGSPSLPLVSRQNGYTHRLGGAKVLVGQNNGLALSNISEGDSLAFSNLQLSPLNADYLEVKAKPLDNQTQPLKLQLSIDDKKAGFYSAIVGKDNLARVPLSKDWHWFAQNKIDSIFLVLPPGRSLEILDCKLIKAEEIAPKLTLSKHQESYEGVAEIDSKEPAAIETTIVLPALTKVDRLQIEISKANTFFENFPENQDNSAVLTNQNYEVDKHVSSNIHHIHVDKSSLARGCYHQFRVRMLDAQGKNIGELSNPVTIRLR